MACCNGKECDRTPKYTVQLSVTVWRVPIGKGVLNYKIIIGDVRGHTSAHEPGLCESESDVCRRQILTSKVGPRTEKMKLFCMVVDP